MICKERESDAGSFFKASVIIFNTKGSSPQSLGCPLSESILINSEISTHSVKSFIGLIAKVISFYLVKLKVRCGFRPLFFI